MSDKNTYFFKKNMEIFQDIKYKLNLTKTKLYMELIRTREKETNPRNSEKIAS